jgi:hypothetical protein
MNNHLATLRNQAVYVSPFIHGVRRYSRKGNAWRLKVFGAAENFRRASAKVKYLILCLNYFDQDFWSAIWSKTIKFRGLSVSLNRSSMAPTPNRAMMVDQSKSKCVGGAGDWGC